MVTIAPSTPAPILSPLTAYTPKSPAWLWPGRLPLGKLTLLAGDPGIDKSLLAAHIAAAVSANLPWPGSEPTAACPEPVEEAYFEPAQEACPEPVEGSVLLLSAEDDPADTLLPRILAAGGDPARIH